MSLKLQLKEGLFNILDLLPERAGFYFYHKIQDAVNGEDMLQRVKSNEHSYETLQKILQQLRVSLEGKKVLEIGSGWAPVMPYFMLYRGKAESVATYDLNRHFSKRNTLQLNKVFSSEYGIEVAPGKSSPFNLPQPIQYFPQANLVNETLPVTDIVFSRFVLEHVRPEDIAMMHNKFKGELKPGTFIIHLISPSDHRAYVDKGLSLQDFLRYSEAEWRKQQTKFDYHNRLRLPQYLKLFQAAGLEVILVEFDNPKPDSHTYKIFKKVPLHKDFRQFTEQELTAGSINVVLKV